MTSHIMLLVPSNRFTRQALCDPKTFQFQIWKCYVVLSPQFSRTGWLNTKGLSGKNVQTAPFCWESVPTGQKVSSAKRLGGQLGGQFLHIMGNTHQAPLRVHLVSPSQMESPEALVVFDVSKNRLDLGRPSRSQVLPLGTGQIVSSLSAIVQEAEANPDLAVALGAGTFSLERALGAVLAGVDASLRLIPVVGRLVGGGNIVQSLVGRADEVSGGWIIPEVFGPELVGAHDFGRAIVMGVLVEGIVLEQVTCAVPPQIGLVLLAAISGIGHNLLR